MISLHDSSIILSILGCDFNEVTLCALDPVVRAYGTGYMAGNTAGTKVLSSTVTYKLRNSLVTQPGYLVRVVVGASAAFSVTVVVTAIVGS